jgi:hypothetical protein
MRKWNFILYFNHLLILCASFINHFILLLLFVINCTKHCIQENRDVNVMYMFLAVLNVSCDLITETLNVEVANTKLS